MNHAEQVGLWQGALADRRALGGPYEDKAPTVRQLVSVAMEFRRSAHEYRRWAAEAAAGGKYVTQAYHLGKATIAWATALGYMATARATQEGH